MTLIARAEAWQLPSQLSIAGFLALPVCGSHLPRLNPQETAQAAPVPPPPIDLDAFYSADVVKVAALINPKSI